TIDELKLMQTKLENLRTPLPKVYASYYGEDWKTQGDWVGRTFRDWAVLCAVNPPFDLPIYYTDEFYSVHEFIGPNHPDKTDVIRRWVHKIKTEDQRTLYNPWFGYRCQAEWDDHGEAYSLTIDGPDLWYILRIRNKGTFKVGMYFFNKDGHNGPNRLRDYTIEIYTAPLSWKISELPTYNLKDWQKYSEISELQTHKNKPLLKSRVNNFWGGVHKQFTVTGQGFYLVKIDRNYSFNTIISSVSIDRLNGNPTWHEEMGIPRLAQIPYNPPTLPQFYETGEGWQIDLLLSSLKEKYGNLNGIECQHKIKIALLHFVQSMIPDKYKNKKDDQDSFDDEYNNNEFILLRNFLEWKLNLWNDKQRKEWRGVMRIAHEKLLRETPDLQKIIDVYKNH
ncbi:MAG: hypothetical protein LBE13_16330, partial [Bacteroidales bacterium]|nr:hypothetical protein [Bacteroidales bacterium]